MKNIGLTEQEAHRNAPPEFAEERKRWEEYQERLKKKE